MRSRRSGRIPIRSIHLIVALTLSATLAVLLPVVQTRAVQTLPHAFFGTVTYVGGDPVPAGTLITTMVDGQLSGNITTKCPGKYGSDENGDFGPGILKLLVQGSWLENGDIIEFYVGGVKAIQTYPFQTDTITELNLTVEFPYPNWDVNTDGCVNVLDLITVGQHWGESGGPHWIRADVNSDGMINVLDLIPVGQHWLEGCSG